MTIQRNEFEVCVCVCVCVCRYVTQVDPPRGLAVDTTPFWDAATLECIQAITDTCDPNNPVTKGCNICQLNWDAKPADGSGQKAYPKAGYTCAQLATMFESSVARLEALNPTWDCSQKQPYSNKNFCQGDSCGNP